MNIITKFKSFNFEKTSCVTYNPAAVMTFGATLSGMRPAIRSNVFFVARWVRDLSLISSCHREKVRFSAAFKNNSSHPSVVMLSSLEESAAKLLLDWREDSGVVRSPLPLRTMSTMILDLGEEGLLPLAAGCCWPKCKIGTHLKLLDAKSAT